VDIFDVNAIAWFDRKASCAGFVFAELEFAEDVVARVVVSAVVARRHVSYQEFSGVWVWDKSGVILLS
jgi:hypothetical protein